MLFIVAAEGNDLMAAALDQPLQMPAAVGMVFDEQDFHCGEATASPCGTSACTVKQQDNCHPADPSYRFFAICAVIGCQISTAFSRETSALLRCAGALLDTAKFSQMTLSRAFSICCCYLFVYGIALAQSTPPNESDSS